MVNRIIVDPVWRAEGQPAICAAREHDIRAGREAERLHRGNHVNVVIGGPAGTVHCQEALPSQAAWIDRVAEDEIAAKVNLCHLIKSWCDIRVLGIARTKAVKRATEVRRATD